VRRLPKQHWKNTGFTKVETYIQSNVLQPEEEKCS
jgi:hypothetical protein